MVKWIESERTDCEAIKMHTCGHGLMEIIKKENSYIQPAANNNVQCALCTIIEPPLHTVCNSTAMVTRFSLSFSHSLSLAHSNPSNTKREIALYVIVSAEKNGEGNTIEREEKEEEKKTTKSFQQVKRKAIISFACNLIHLKMLTKMLTHKTFLISFHCVGTIFHPDAKQRMCGRQRFFGLSLPTTKDTHLILWTSFLSSSSEVILIIIITREHIAILRLGSSIIQHIIFSLNVDFVALFALLIFAFHWHYLLCGLEWKRRFLMCLHFIKCLITALDMNFLVVVIAQIRCANCARNFSVQARYIVRIPMLKWTCWTF